tara:strand:- start:54 stop:281 length:228 start_codon:yes stop_codon:yes gene_type:complete
MGSVQVLCNIFQVVVVVEQILADQVLINQLVVQVVVDKDKVVLEVEQMEQLIPVAVEEVVVDNMLVVVLVDLELL